jgi:BASS family bile acid:Na+ symporter
MGTLEAVRLNFDEGSLFLLNACLAFIMYSVALNMDWQSLRYTLTNPRSVTAGLISQLVVLPLITILLILLLKPEPGIAMGMALLAACPGGNVSNFFSLVARGNIALSVTLTTISSLASVITTPLIFTAIALLLGSNKEASFDLPFWETFVSILLIIVIPALAGMLTSARFPLFTSRVNRLFQRVSLAILALFIGVALHANLDQFTQHIGSVFMLVAAHNLLAFLGGYGTARVFQLPITDRKTISLETGIQNTALGLVIVFNFFDGNGAMSFILAWWGVWHLIAGFGVAHFYKRFLPQQPIA